MRVKKGSLRVDHEGKGTEKEEKRDDACVKDLILVHTIGHAGIQAGKPNRRWQVDVSFDKWNNFGP